MNDWSNVRVLALDGRAGNVVAMVDSYGMNNNRG